MFCYVKFTLRGNGQVFWLIKVTLVMDRIEVSVAGDGYFRKAVATEHPESAGWIIRRSSGSGKVRKGLAGGDAGGLEVDEEEGGFPRQAAHQLVLPDGSSAQLRELGGIISQDGGSLGHGRFGGEERCEFGLSGNEFHSNLLLRMGNDKTLTSRS